MNGLKALLGVITLASLLFVGLCLSAACTPSTCHDGPVVAQFWTPDCSDAPTFYEMILNDCDGSGGTYGQVAGDSLIFTSGNFDCRNYSQVNTTYTISAYKFGACVRTSSTAARMHLRTVNDSYISPQPFSYDPAVMTYPAILSATCSGIDNCTDNDGNPAKSWSTYHSGTGSFCPPADYSQIRFTLVGVCSNYQNYTYKRTGCIDQFGDWEALYSDPNCSDPIDLTITRTLCGYTSSVVHCSDTPIPVPDIFPFDVYPPFTPNTGSGSPSSPSSVSPSSPTASPTASTPTSTASSLQNTLLIFSLLSALLVSMIF